MFEIILEILPVIFLVISAGLSIAAGVGLLRFPDVLTRLHAVTKPQIFGVLLTIAAIAIDQRSVSTLIALIPVFIFQTLNAPVAAHMVGRASYRTGKVAREDLILDELKPAVERAYEKNDHSNAGLEEES